MVEGTLPPLVIMEDLEQRLLRAAVVGGPNDYEGEATNLLLTYNRCLLLLAQGNLAEAMQHSYDRIQPIMKLHPGTHTPPQPPPPPQQYPPLYYMAAMHLGCLYLECILIGTAGDDPTEGMDDLVSLIDHPHRTSTATVDQILQWMDRSVEHVMEDDQDMHHLIKFTLCLYTARMELAKKKPPPLPSSDGSAAGGGGASHQPIKSNDQHHHKVARKELKQALEIFSTKLIRANPTHDSASLRSGSQASLFLQPPSSPSLPVVAAVPSTTTHEPQPLTSPVLAQLYQAALNLKAHTEQLKGNVKKSLILCQEAKSNSSTITINNNNHNRNHISHSSNPNTKKRASATAAARTPMPTSTTSISATTTSTMLMHDNNLAQVYATSGKRYLACHAWSKAVEKGALALEQGTTARNTNYDNKGGSISTDGTIALPMHFTQANLVWNASLANLMLPDKQNYIASYQGLASLLSSACGSNDQHRLSIPWIGQRKRQARLWLRLGEACVGMFVQQRQQVQQQQQPQSTTNVQGIQVGGYVFVMLCSSIFLLPFLSHQFSFLQCSLTDLPPTLSHSNSQWKGIVLDSLSSKDLPHIGQLAPDLGSPQDMEQLLQNPLPRARVAFEMALRVMDIDEDRNNISSTERLAALSAQVSLAYIALELKDYPTALAYAQEALQLEEQRVGDELLPMLDAAGQSLWKRQQATARMYASEAACLLGDATSSIKYLVGDGKNDAFDRLAVELGGVTLEMASRDPHGKKRLAKAQAMVRCSASAASACLGNLSAAKQLAMSAQAMSREGSYATRALVYCLLQEGNRGTALKLLTSAR
jgi:tetratricopeptide (TPR) repeat protein